MRKISIFFDVKDDQTKIKPKKEGFICIKPRLPKENDTKKTDTPQEAFDLIKYLGG